jgi:hypothetical protein
MPPDSPSGFFPGTINYFSGGVSGGTYSDGSLPTTVPVYGYTATDSHGNVYVALGNPGAIYVVYGGNTIPQALLNITAAPEAGRVYQVAGFGVSGCGACEGLPLNKVAFISIQGFAIDSHDNLYYSDGESSTAGIADVVRKVDGVTSIVTTIAGQWGINNSSFSTSIGDGGPATAAVLYQPTDIKFDQFGNLFIDDTFNDVVRVVYTGTQPPPILAAEGTSAGTGQQGFIFSVAGQVTYFCTTLNGCGDGSSAIPYTGSAGLGFQFSIGVDPAGNVYIADAFSSGGPYIRVVYAGGAVPAVLDQYLNPGGGNAVTPSNGFIYPVTGYGVGSPPPQFGPCAGPGCGDGGLSADAVFGNGNLYLTLDDLGNMYVADYASHAVRKIDISGYASTVAGIDDPTQTPPATIPVPPGGPAVGTYLNAPFFLSFDAGNDLFISDSNLVWKAAPLLPQTITFPSFNPAVVTYGAGAISLSATASSGLPVQYSVTSKPSGIATLNSSQLIISGAGAVTVTASQPGSDAYAAAPSIARTLTVNPAPLTVTANNASMVQGTQVPTFAATIAGFVNGDTSSTPGAYSGAPAFTTKPKATSTSPGGTYQIIPSLGTLTSKNYSFPAANFIAGVLEITGSKSQSINFPPLSPSTVMYGHVPITLSATATSSLPVSFVLVSGPGLLSGANNAILTITGVGAIVVKATQGGDFVYAAAAPVEHTLSVSPAMLTVTGPTVTTTYGIPIDTTTFPPASITGFVGSDTESSVLTGSAQYTTVSGTPSAGTYPIAVGLGTLTLLRASAANYTFATPVNGSLVVNPAAQTINFNPIPTSATYGTQIQLTAQASSSLPVTFAVSGPASLPFNGVLQLNGVGNVTVKAVQAGNSNYLPAVSVSQNVSAIPAPLNITMSSVTREQGTPNPIFTYTVGCTLPVVGCFVLGDTDIPSVITGVPNVTTTADQSSPPGTYPITATQGTLVAPNYSFVFVNGTLTVTPPGVYTISANPSSLNIPRGQSAQTTLTITPANSYQGTVTLSCGQLPANVTCVVSPATYTFPGSQNPDGSENAAQGTVTINTSAGTIVGSAARGARNVNLAAVFFPGVLTTFLFVFARARNGRRVSLWRMMALLGASIAILCTNSCSGSKGIPTAAPGTVTVMINGDGTTPSGTGSVTASAPLVVTIQ